jgi:hypothetical protein
MHHRCKEPLSVTLFLSALFSTDHDKILESSVPLKNECRTNQAVAASPRIQQTPGAPKEQFSLPTSNERLQLLCSKSFQITLFDKTSD